MSNLAFRCYVDAQRYAVVHAATELLARDAFGQAFPERPWRARPVPWLDDARPEGTVDVHDRLFCLSVRTTT